MIKEKLYSVIVRVISSHVLPVASQALVLSVIITNIKTVRVRHQVLSARPVLHGVQLETEGHPASTNAKVITCISL